VLGRLLIDTKSIESRTIDKIQSKALEIGIPYLSLFTKRTRCSKEYLSKCILNDVNAQFCCVDTPSSHKSFPVVLNGLSLSDIVVLVVSAIESEKNIPYCINCLLATFALGVSKVILLVNKIDAIGENQDQINSI